MKNEEEQLSDEGRFGWFGRFGRVWVDWAGWRGNGSKQRECQAGGWPLIGVRRGSSPDPATLTPLVGRVGLGGRWGGAINGTGWAVYAVTHCQPWPALPFVFAIGQAARHPSCGRHQSALDGSAPKHSILHRSQIAHSLPPTQNKLSPSFGHSRSLPSVPVPPATAVALGRYGYGNAQSWPMDCPSIQCNYCFHRSPVWRCLTHAHLLLRCLSREVERVK